MNLIDFNDCPLSGRMYGGMAGRKEGIIYEGDYWIIKYPDNLKERDLKNIDISYGNNPISEYIGSHLFELAGIPVHETLLGTRNNKIVIACKDFVGRLSKLVEFREYKISYIPTFINKDGDMTNGIGMDIEEALLCVNKHPFLSSISLVQQRFWEMFIIDYLNGNSDRNNGNWGCIHNLDTDTVELAPVYDNGNCLNHRLSATQILEALTNLDRFKELTNSVRSRFTFKGHSINPYKYIDDSNDVGLIKTLESIISKIRIENIYKLLDSIELEDKNRIEFYKRVYCYRLDKLTDLCVNKKLVSNHSNPIEDLKSQL